MKPKFDETIPAEISRLALERITSRQSFLTRSDIDAGTKRLHLLWYILAVPDFHLTKPEKAFQRGREQEND